ncbi:hypothetical protein H9Q70_001617 [Fusarium xylarioides]|nr:hypothetical protein H9Q70_001617 [Fusarium xylarioides]KAG5777054.1 hypothetical protein H9Q73_009284 [Fusarium xylarioides]
MTTTTSLELATIRPTDDGEAGIPSIDALPPTDRGRGAYTALACCTIAQAPIWGYSVSFGIFQEYYTAHANLKASPSAIASIGASQTGIMYLMMPVAFIALNRFPRLRKWCGPLGLAITIISLTASAFVGNVAGLIATQGVLYAIGCSLLFSPISLYMDEWFVERKGFAYGVMWAGKSSVGVAMPFLFNVLLQRFGLKATLLSWTVASMAMTLPTLFFLKPRVEIGRESRPRPISFAFFGYTSFWMLQFGIIVQSLGYLMPSTYLASYATAIGLSSVTGPILLALFSLASVPGSLIHGMLGDKISGAKNILVSSLGSALPPHKHYGGLCDSVWLLCWWVQCDMVRSFARSQGDERIDRYILGICGALISAGSSLASGDSLGYATKYGPMILCTGVTAILGAWSPICKIAKSVGKKGLERYARLML